MLDGEWIRELRLQKALSQGALGTLLAKDGQYVSKLERGILTSVTSETLARLADALGCSTDSLLGRCSIDALQGPGRRRVSSLRTALAQIYKTELFEHVKALESMFKLGGPSVNAQHLPGHVYRLRLGLMHLQEVLKEHPRLHDEPLDEKPVR